MRVSFLDHAHITVRANHQITHPSSIVERPYRTIPLDQLIREDVKKRIDTRNHPEKIPNAGGTAASTRTTSLVELTLILSLTLPITPHLTLHLIAMTMVSSLLRHYVVSPSSTPGLLTCHHHCLLLLLRSLPCHLPLLLISIMSTKKNTSLVHHSLTSTTLSLAPPTYPAHHLSTDYQLVDTVRDGLRTQVVPLVELGLILMVTGTMIEDLLKREVDDDLSL